MIPESIIWLVCSFLAVLIVADEEVLLDIPQGTLKGIKSTTILNETPIYSFTGIRYAKSLKPSNKFKISEPPESWTGVYDATHHGSGCVAFCMVRQMVVGNDDCLFINVYTPEPNKDAKRAVMVFIHGGGFNVGSGDQDMYGPDYLIEQDVVLVTFNYRLGPFGFLSTGDSASPGNVGLKDQSAALKWVQDNIYYFGGCPHRVTIFGQNAGASSVQYHMMSPMSTGLFSQAISQSGSPLATWAITYHPKESAFKLGKTLGIETTDTVELVNELTKIPSDQIIEATMAVDISERSANGHLSAFIPCVEPDVGQEIFLTTDPWEMIKKGKLSDVPYMSGLNQNESLFITNVLEEMAEIFNEHFEYFLPDDLNITDTNEQKRIGNMLKKFYYGDKQLTRDFKREYGQLTMDVMFLSNVEIPLRIINSLKSKPTYNYLFTHESPIGMYKDFKFYDGVLHADELSYIFFAKAIRSKPEVGSMEEKVIRLVTKLWTNFAKTGNPTSMLDEDVTMNWEPIGKENNYAIINEDLTMGHDMFKERIDLWVSIYKDVIGDYINLF